MRTLFFFLLLSMTCAAQQPIVYVRPANQMVQPRRSGNTKVKTQGGITFNQGGVAVGSGNRTVNVGLNVVRSSDGGSRPLLRLLFR